MYIMLWSSDGRRLRRARRNWRCSTKVLALPARKAKFVFVVTEACVYQALVLLFY